MYNSYNGRDTSLRYFVFGDGKTRFEGRGYAMNAPPRTDDVCVRDLRSATDPGRFG